MAHSAMSFGFGQGSSCTTPQPPPHTSKISQNSEHAAIGQAPKKYGRWHQNDSNTQKKPPGMAEISYNFLHMFPGAPGIWRLVAGVLRARNATNVHFILEGRMSVVIWNLKWELVEACSESNVPVARKKWVVRFFCYTTFSCLKLCVARYFRVSTKHCVS